MERLMLILAVGIIVVALFIQNLRNVNSYDPTNVTISDREFISVKNVRPARLIIHVGPPKTATTTIQCSLVGFEKAMSSTWNNTGIEVVETQSCRNFLAKDRMKQYKEKFPFVADEEFEDDSGLTSYKKVVTRGAWMPACLGSWKAPTANNTGGIPSCWESYKKFILNHYRHDANKTTFVISNENIGGTLGNFDSNVCAGMFQDMAASLGDEFKIDLIFTYRHLWDLMISFYYYRYGTQATSSRPRFQKWPGQGGRSAPALSKFSGDEFKASLNALDTYNCLRQASAASARVNLHVIDYGRRNVLYDFLRYLSIDNQTANNLIEESSSLGMNQRAEYLTWNDKIAISARKKGMIPPGVVRRVARNTIDKYLSEEGERSKSIFLEFNCPNDLIREEIFSASVELYQSVFNATSLEAQAELTASFEDAFSSKKICDMDSDAFLLNHTALQKHLLDNSTWI